MGTRWPLKPTARLTYDDYTVAWLCALPIELLAARNMLDELHDSPTAVNDFDKNSYEFGKICGHNVVIVCQSEMGSTPATVVATRMDFTFRKLRFGLLVGIGAGVPENADVRLGDVVISKGDGKSGGVVSHDRGKITSAGFESKPFLNGVPELLKNAFVRLESLVLGHEITTARYLARATERNGYFAEFARPISLEDNLFQSDYLHNANNSQGCLDCDKKRRVHRQARVVENESFIHFGIVASGNQVIKNAHERVEIARWNGGVKAIEMEAAGLMDMFGCATIRGICDYADSHKNDGWHMYAAAAAAAVAKEVLGIIPVTVIAKTPAMPVSETRNIHWLVPRQVNAQFTGRKKILETLREKLCPPKDKEKTAMKQMVFVIRGIGGSGKSEVSLKFAQENKNQFWGIFWVDCSKIGSIKSSYAAIAKKCGIDGVFDETKIWLENTDHSWLLIMDNADALDIDYSYYMPSGHQGSILISSRNPECVALSTVGHETFEKLEYDDAVELLLKSAGIEENEWEIQRNGAKTVVELLAQLALAIVQAGAYTKKMCTLQEYPQLFQTERERLLRYHKTQAKSAYGDVYATFEVSASVLHASNNPVYRSALDLLDVLAYMNFHGVTENMWKRAWDESQLDDCFDHDDNTSVQVLTDWHKSYIPKFIRSRHGQLDLPFLREAIDVLASFSLVHIQSGTRSLTMHPLAHAWARDRLNVEDQRRAWTQSAVILAVAMGGHDYDLLWRDIHLHVQFCVQVWPEDIWVIYPTLELVRICFSLSYLLYWEQSYTVAKRLLTLILDRHDFAYGGDDWLNIQYCLALCLDTAEAKVAFYEKLEGFTAITANKSLQWEIKSGLADAYGSIGQKGKALSVIKEVFREKRAALSAGDLRLLYSQTLLANYYIELGRYGKATKLLVEVVEIEGRTREKTHPDVLASRMLLARAYLKRRMYDKAIEIYEDVVEIQRKISPPTNSRLLISQHYLALAYLLYGVNLGKAVELQEGVVEVERQTLKPTDDSRLQSQLLLGQIHLANKSFTKAAAILEEVVCIRKQKSDPSEYDLDELHYSQYHLGRAYYRNKMYDKAIEILGEVVQIKNFCEFLSSHAYFAKSYWRNSNKKAAVELLEDVLPTVEQRLDSSNICRREFEQLLAGFRRNSEDFTSSEIEPDDWLRSSSIIEDDSEDSENDTQSKSAEKSQTPSRNTKNLDGGLENNSDPWTNGSGNDILQTRPRPIPSSMGTDFDGSENPQDIDQRRTSNRKRLCTEKDGEDSAWESFSDSNTTSTRPRGRPPKSTEKKKRGRPRKT